MVHVHEEDFQMLPEGCIANIVSMTSPRDACRLSLVSRIFKSAADSDAVWDRLLPPDYHDIASSLKFSSLKELYFTLCNSPILIDDGKMSFQLDKWSGKKCYMLSARALSIAWGDTSRYWSWISAPDSRFSEVAELKGVCWLEIRGKININLLSPGTNYAAYLVFKTLPGCFGFDMDPVEVRFGPGSEGEERMAYLDNPTWHQGLLTARGYFQCEAIYSGYNDDRALELPVSKAEARPRIQERADGWSEIELGEFFIKEGEDWSNGELQMSVMEVKGSGWKGGLIVEGIEIRPKDGTMKL